MHKSLALPTALVSFALTSCSTFELPDVNDSQTAALWHATPLPHPLAPLPRTASGKVVAPPIHGAECKVVVLVEANGSVRSANAVRHGEPDRWCPEEFAKVAETEVLAWHFVPAHREGTAIASLEKVRVRFEAATAETARR